MAVAIRMPQPGQMTEECTVLQWYKAEGDRVSRGDPLFEIETDKSNMEIEAFDEGVLLRIDAPEGATVPVDAVVAWIGEAGEAIPEAAPSPWAPSLGRRGSPAAGQAGAGPAEPGGRPSPGQSAALVTYRVARGVRQRRRHIRRPERIGAAPPGQRRVVASRHGHRPTGARSGRVWPSAHAPVAWPRSWGSTRAASTGTGPGGRIVERDVRSAADAAASAGRGARHSA